MKPKLVRRAQTLSPFGVGAILDVEGESFVAVDITHWKNQGESINEPRLESLLGVVSFRMGPAAPDNPHAAPEHAHAIPYYRFPQWLFCSGCRRMSRWSRKKETGDPPVCGVCSRKRVLTPMRFVMACPRGHLADVPWDRWAHSRKQGKCEHQDLEFVTRPGGSGLEFLAVRCRACRAERNLAGIASPDRLREIGARCPGRQPWQMYDDETRGCDAVPQVLQRGATNLTFGSVESSIDIPPYSNYSSFTAQNLLVTSTPEFLVIMSAPTSSFAQSMVEKIAIDLEMSVEEVRRIVEAEVQIQGQKTADARPPEDERGELLSEEYRAFLAPDTEGDPRDRFIKRRVPLGPFLAEAERGAYGAALRQLGENLEALAQVTRLREVRALRGFSRLSPPAGVNDGEGPGKFSLHDTPRKIAPLLVPADLGRLPRDSRWLPAIEVFGEGIFFNLDPDAVRSWESASPVRERVQMLRERYSPSAGLPMVPTPRLVLLHTLAHILVRQLSFECGYTLASLRERVYAGEPGEGQEMAGILIYTAAGDAEGTLGGLVREGEADRLLPTMIKALQSAEWCSSDPLCRESHGQGIRALNLAACHACALLPETSCTMANSLLDRVLVLGSTENPELGFFSGLVQHMMSVTGAER